MALRIPKDVAKTLQIENNSTLELHVEDGKMVVEPQKDDLLESLVSRIDTDNVHSEIDTGGALGNEAW